MSQYLQLSEEIADAIASGLPVVALESTIISHGMPYPRNVETAMSVEETVRQAGAIPATTALINGKMVAGLSLSDIERIGKAGQLAAKASRRDFTSLLSGKLLGSTTVAGTIIIAQKAGIKIMATGGIGGVHRGATTTFDISADLPELAITNIAVFCAGIKSILDIKLTLEYLETLGVPVVGYQTGGLPLFYTRESEFGVNAMVENPNHAAGYLKTKWDAGLEGGVLIACPIPKEHEPDARKIQKAIESAVKESVDYGISGSRVTPFLLARVEELTRGRSLDANIHLVVNNARIAAQTAVAFSKM